MSEQALQTCFASPYRQIASPYRLAADVLRSFLTHRAKLLLSPTWGKPVSALLTSFDEQSLIAAYDRAERFTNHRQRILLVIFPVSPDCSYVLQTQVANVYSDRVRLRYQDPRLEPRMHFPTPEPVRLCIAPPSVASLFRAQRYQLTRELGSRPGASPGVNAASLVDVLSPTGKTGSTASGDVFGNAPWWTGTLGDISRGGACLLVPDAPLPVPGSELVVRCQIPLPPIVLGEEAQETVHFTLTLLGVVRGTQPVAGTVAFHLRFVEPLPADFTALFARLQADGQREGSTRGI